MQRTILSNLTKNVSVRSRSLRWTALGAGLVALTAAVGCDDSSSDDSAASNSGGQSSSGGGDSETGGSASGGSASGGLGGDAPGGAGGSLGGTGSGGANLGGAGGAPQAVTQCSSTVPAATKEKPFSELCHIDGEAQHVRIEGLLAPNTHASAQLLFGADTVPAVSSPVPGAGELDAIFYGGGSIGPGGSIPPQVSATFGAAEGTLVDNSTFLFAATTTCFDLFHGSDSTPPHMVVWVDGQNGADCEDFATLTLASSVGRELWWSGSVTGAINDGKSVYFRQAAGEATVTLFDAPALTEAALPPFQCSTEVPATENGYVELCKIDEPVRHVRIDGAYGAAAAHNVTQVVFGFEQTPVSPLGALGAGQFLQQFYAGGSGQIDVKFSSGAATFTEGADFFQTASTVCFDLHDGSAEKAPYYVLWADGKKGADCDDRATLTLDSALAQELSFGDTKGAVNKLSSVYFRQTGNQAATVTSSSVPALTDEQIEAD